MTPSQAAAYHASIVHSWMSGAADDLLARLLRSANRTTRRLYAADIRQFCIWLGSRGYGPAETPPLAFAIFLGYGPARAQKIVETYRDHLLTAGKSLATCNRHLATLRGVVRIAGAEMGRIDWAICVPNVRDNVLCPKGEAHARAA